MSAGVPVYGHCVHGLNRGLYGCQKCEIYERQVEREERLAATLDRLADAVEAMVATFSPTLVLETPRDDA